MPDNKPVKTKRDLALDRLRNKYPDEQFDDDEQVFGRINDDYDQYDKELNGYKEREGKFADMFSSDRRSARMMMAWKDGDDPVITLMRMYGPELKDALDDPEKQEKLAEANKEYMERQAKEKEYEEKFKTNLAQSLDQLEQLQNEEGYDDQTVSQAAIWLATVAKDFMQGKFTPETISFAIKAQNYDNDVEQASTEGEVRGKNTRVTEELRKPKRGDGTANLDGKNNSSRQRMQQPDLGETLNRYADGNLNIFERGGEKRTPVKR